MTGGQLTIGAKDRGAKDRGANDRGAKDRGANDPDPSRVVLRGAGIIMFDSHIVCKLCMVLWRDL